HIGAPGGSRGIASRLIRRGHILGDRRHHACRRVDRRRRDCGIRNWRRRSRGNRRGNRRGGRRPPPPARHRLRDLHSAAPALARKRSRPRHLVERVLGVAVRALQDGRHACYPSPSLLVATIAASALAALPESIAVAATSMPVARSGAAPATTIAAAALSIAM